ncbi:MAG: hypothetical protein YHS30scaffold324_69 [Catenulispora phage 69_17]|nr:MAG: hypothetical protein YHS30scaffold324_69 [Catenulispora phage 69_17]
MATPKKKAAAAKHPGFQNTAAKIARKQGVGPAAAQRILASQTRKASPAAKRANPNLKKVPPSKKKG